MALASPSRFSVFAAAMVLAVAAGSLAAPSPAAAAGGADLSVSISSEPNSPATGDEFTLTVIVANGGPDAAEDVVFGITLDYPFEILGADGPELCRRGYDRPSLVCPAGTLAGGGSVQLRVKTRTRSAGVYEVVAAATSATADPDTEDRTARATVIVQGSPSSAERGMAGLFKLVLKRDPSATESAAWVRRLDPVAGVYIGTTRTRVVSALIASPEARRLRVAETYQRMLGREATGAEVTWWTARLVAGRSVESMELDLAASAEFARVAGAGSGAFVARAYDTLVGRAASATDRAHWSSVLASGRTRRFVAGQLQGSLEAQVRVADRRYQEALGRDTEELDRYVWISNLRAGQSVDSQWARFLATTYLDSFPYSGDLLPGYYGRAAGPVPVPDLTLG